jgi:hypothetical protein
MQIRKLLGEPMLHFIVLGIALFAVHRQLTPGPSGGRNRIVVTRGVVSDLSTQHQARWGRPPSPSELTGLVDSYIHDEILYREGVALGLDRDDPVVKRRVRQKLEVMSEEETPVGTPTDAELSEYLARNAARFTRPMVMSFEQVFLGPSAAGARIERVGLQRDTSGTAFDPTGLRKPSMLPETMTASAADLVAREFGAAFEKALETVPVGEWAGPFDSTFGSHFVRVEERIPSVVPPLSEVRDAVVREWENERRQRAKDDSYQKLRRTYAVDIEAELPTSAR